MSNNIPLSKQMTPLIISLKKKYTWIKRSKSHDPSLHFPILLVHLLSLKLSLLCKSFKHLTIGILILFNWHLLKQFFHSKNITWKDVKEGAVLC